MKILITGADGQLGLAFRNLLFEEKDVTLICTGRSKKDKSFFVSMDITDGEMVSQVIGECRPDIVINCAAFTKVDLCETQYNKAYAVNAAGVENLARAAEKVEAKFVQVSTDYVFDGMSTKPYKENDPVCPVNQYGKSKLEGECLALENCHKTFVVRTAWLYGEGSNFLKTMVRLSQNHESISVVDDQFGTPTSTIELAKMIWFLVQKENYGVYHGTCEGQASWYEFAKEIMKGYGCNTKVLPIRTEEYPVPAKRPAYAVLENNRLHLETDYVMKDWKQALKEYIMCYKKEDLV